MVPQTDLFAQRWVYTYTELLPKAGVAADLVDFLREGGTELRVLEEAADEEGGASSCSEESLLNGEGDGQQQDEQLDLVHRDCVLAGEMGTLAGQRTLIRLVPADENKGAPATGAAGVAGCRLPEPEDEPKIAGATYLHQLPADPAIGGEEVAQMIINSNSPPGTPATVPWEPLSS